MYEWTYEDREDYSREQREAAGRDEEIGQELESRAAIEAITIADEDEDDDVQLTAADLARIAAAGKWMAAELAAHSPLAIANAWAASQRVAAPQYAEIGNGLFVRMGTGRKRRAA
jgi:hypothetical protein